MARILSTSYIHVHVHTRTINVCAMLMISYVILKYAPYDWLKCNPRLQKKKSRAGAGALEGALLVWYHIQAWKHEASENMQVSVQHVNIVLSRTPKSPLIWEILQTGLNCHLYMCPNKKVIFSF